MSAQQDLLLADAILAVHLAIILFNLFGLVVVPLGFWLGWRFVRIFWWRALHLAVLALVALQAALGQVCVLTDWQAALQRAAGAGGAVQPLIAGFVDRLIYWRLPLWVFAAIYVAVWAYALLLWRLVPPRLRQSDSGGGAATRRH